MRSRYACTLDCHDFDDFRPVELAHRTDPGTAARLFAERLCREDSDYYATFEGGERVHVRCLMTGAESFWVVGVEFSPSFSCFPAKESDEGSEGAA